MALPGRAAGDPQLPRATTPWAGSWPATVRWWCRSGPTASTPTTSPRADGGADARGQLVLEHLRLWQQWAACARGTLRRPLRRPGGPPEGRPDGALPRRRGGGGRRPRSTGPAAPPSASSPSRPWPRSTSRPGAARCGPPGRPAHCDGDVSDLQGAAYYDDSRYAVPGDQTAKQTTLLYGANHNFFNSVWTSGPGSFDDAGFLGELGSPARRGRGVPRRGRGAWRAAGQRAAGADDHGGFLRRFVLGEEAWPLRHRGGALPRLVRRGPVVGGLPRRTPPRRGPVGRRERRPHRPPRGPGQGAGGQPGPGLRRGCGGVLLPGSGRPARPAALPGPGPPGGDQHDRRPRRGLDPRHRHRSPPGWTPGGTDVSGYDGLRFRLAVPPDGRNDRRDRQDLTVRLTDASGARAVVAGGRVRPTRSPPGPPRPWSTRCSTGCASRSRPSAGSTSPGWPGSSCSSTARPRDGCWSTTWPSRPRAPATPSGPPRGRSPCRPLPASAARARCRRGRARSVRSRGAGSRPRGRSWRASPSRSSPRRCGGPASPRSWAGPPRLDPSSDGWAAAPGGRLDRAALRRRPPLRPGSVGGRHHRPGPEHGLATRRRPAPPGTWSTPSTWPWSVGCRGHGPGLLGRRGGGRPHLPAGPGPAHQRRAGRAGGRRALRPDRRPQPRCLRPGLLGGGRPHRGRRAAPGDRAPGLGRARRASASDGRSGPEEPPGATRRTGLRRRRRRGRRGAGRPAPPCGPPRRRAPGCSRG